MELLGSSLVLLAGIEAGRCLDDRYPALFGHYVLWCARSGNVDTARDLWTSIDHELNVVAPSPLVRWNPGDGGTLWVGEAGPKARWERFGFGELPVVSPAPALVTGGEVVAAAAGAESVALAMANRIEVAWEGGNARVHLDAQVLPGELVAGDGWLAWVSRDGLVDRVHAVSPAGPLTLPESSDSQRLIAAVGDRLAWTEPDGVHVYNVQTTTLVIYPASTGFLHVPAAALGSPQLGDEWCWEDRAALQNTTGDIDIRCSGGTVINRKGNQLSPSMAQDMNKVVLLFHEGKQVWIATWPRTLLVEPLPPNLFRHP